MSLVHLRNSQDIQAYTEYLKNAPGRSLWQSLQWKSYQEALGRETRLYGLERPLDTACPELVEGPRMRGATPAFAQASAGRRGDTQFAATALVVIDRTRGGLAVWDIPRGPVGEPEATAELLRGIMEDAKKEGALAVYFSTTSEVSGLRQGYGRQAGVRCQVSGRKEQPEATVILDLTLSDEELLRQMHEKCRYNIRLAGKRGVVVKESQDVAAFYGMLQETASRDGFIVKPRSHYEKFLTDLPGSFLLLAYADVRRKTRDTRNSLEPQVSNLESLSRPIAGLLGVAWEGRGYYYYGASSYEHRALMAPYLLQWEAMRLCRERGCREYDLLGIESPKAVEPPCHGGSTHAWAGLTRFKLQFGGRSETYPPEQVVVLRPLLFCSLAWKRKILG